MEARKISRKQLKQMYSEMRIKDVARELGITVPTMYSLLDEAGIPRKGYGKKVVLAQE